ncbi:MAG: 50S ribosomal protein L11 methyltransferase [Neisseriaceae bacterium]|nr:MAG: 50S ribosomal protein L11 methyltransferase [Neisseriaceae bacterium]
MSLQELKIILGSEKAEELADALLQRGALSVGIEDAYANTNEEQALFDEPGEMIPGQTIQLWDNSLVLSLFEDSVSVEILATELLQELRISEKMMQIRTIEDQDWVRLNQSQFDAIPVSERLWIVPSWIEKVDSAECVIHLDPGLAFGTGSHPTTYLCLSWLDKNLSKNQSVLDYGCGSGILAIVAKKLGAELVVGVDIDAQAILASNENAKKNGVKIDFFLPKDFKQEQTFDVVVANILANPLRLLASMLANYVHLGGRLVLSGILKSQQEEIIQIYQEWFDIGVYQEKEGWICLVGVKK